MIKKAMAAGFLALLATAISVTTARADEATVDFSYQSDGNTFQWQLPASPTPSGVDVFGIGDVDFEIDNVAVSENGGTPDLENLVFFSLFSQGGFFNFTDIAAFGEQVYMGPETAPTFVPGTYSDLTDFGVNANGVPGTLQITVAPEPSSLLLLAIGVLGVVGLSKKKSVA
jgi:hypothetical protein